ncbi:MAG: glutathione S-transferase family protein [Pseudomonadota bacterium]
MLRIYHVPGTRGMRAIWVCEEISHPYEIVPVDFYVEYRATPEWRKMNPTGKVPVMTDGDLKIFESGAMVHYILDRYGNGQLQPAPGTDAQAIFLQWSWFAEATFARPLGEIVNHRRVFGDNAREDAITEMQSRAHLCVDAIAQELADGRPYLCGDTFNAADIMIAYSLHLQQRLAPTDYTAPLQAYWDRVSSRPAFGPASS